MILQKSQICRYLSGPLRAKLLGLFKANPVPANYLISLNCKTILFAAFKISGVLNGRGLGLFGSDC
jgi:hypothetical protein